MFPNRTTLALCIAALLLSACGGSGAVKSTAPTPATTPPPPLPTSEPCLSPITGDCVVIGQHTPTFDEYGMDGGRQSNYRLFVHGGDSGDGVVNLKQGEYRFAGGTDIAGATLVVWDRLVSDVNIAHDYTGMGFAGRSELWLLGTVRGDVLNEERLNLRCWSGLHACASVPQQRIEGNYTQLDAGLLETTLGRYLHVTGTATLDGYLRLVSGDAGYVLPAAPSSVPILHAAGGINGTFDGWNTNSLFLEGALRYTATDVFFDATRISLQAGAAASGIHHPLTLASAANLDRALAGADGLATTPLPSLGLAQRRFLASAAALLWMQDEAQASRALDSLAGHAHAEMREVLHGQAATAAARTDARLSALAYSTRPLAWSEPTLYASAGQSFAGASSGFGRWLSPRLLVGGSIGDGQGSLYFDHLGGHGQGRSPAASLHAHYRGDGWHATGLAGAQHSTLQLQRPIELGAAGTHLAHSQRVLDQVFMHAEVGRDWTLAGGTLSPFTAVDYTSLQGDGFVEQGATGFELIGTPENHMQLSGTAGARYARTWDSGRPLRLDLAASYRRSLLVGGTPLRAAFSGVPDVWFDLPGGREDGFAELRLGLVGSLGRHWNWSMDYARSLGNEVYDDYRLGLRRAF